MPLLHRFQGSFSLGDSAIHMPLGSSCAGCGPPSPFPVLPRSLKIYALMPFIIFLMFECFHNKTNLKVFYIYGKDAKTVLRIPGHPYSPSFCACMSSSCIILAHVSQGRNELDSVLVTDPSDRWTRASEEFAWGPLAETRTPCLWQESHRRDPVSSSVLCL